MTSVVRSFGTRFNPSAIEDERGLSTVEYTIILLLIAIFAIAAWSAFGSKLNARISEATGELGDISQGDVTGNGQTGE